MTFWKYGLIFVSGLFILTSCDKSGNFGMEESPAWHKRVSTKEKMLYFKPKCQDYGYEDNSDAMRQCIVNEIRISEQAARDIMNTPICTTNSYGTTTCY